MTVTVYRSSDPSAPVWSGAPGSTNAVLKACLVTGYGAKAGSGWTNPFTNGQVEVFRMGGGNKRYLRCDDSMSASTSPYAARLVAYEAMTSDSVGANPFPTAAQQSLGLNIVRAQNTTLGAKEWQIIATDKFFYFIGSSSPTTTTNYPQHFFFGDFRSNVPGDLFNTIICGKIFSANHATAEPVTSVSNSINAVEIGHYVARKFDQLGASYPCGKHTDYAKSPAGTMGTAGTAYPSPSDGGLYLAPVYIHESVGAVGILRGTLPGIWNPCHPSGNFQHHDIVDGAGAMAGKTFEFLVTGSTGVSSVAAYEISDTW